MKKKSVWIFVVSLILMTMVVGVVAAATVNGVEYYNTDGGTKFINHNSYTVRVSYVWGGNSNQKMGQTDLGAGESDFVRWEVKIVSVNPLR